MGQFPKQIFLIEQNENGLSKIQEEKFVLNLSNHAMLQQEFTPCLGHLKNCTLINYSNNSEKQIDRSQRIHFV